MSLVDIVAIICISVGLVDHTLADGNNFPIELRDLFAQNRYLNAQFEIESLLVEYSFPVNEHEKVMREIIAKTPCFFRHDSYHQLLDDSLEDVDRQVTYVLNDRYLTYKPLERSFAQEEWDVRDGLPGTLASEIFFVATGIWPLNDRSPPSPFGFSMALKSLVSTANVTLVSTDESVNGVNCCVIEKVHEHLRDRLWLESERLSILKREIRRKANNRLVVRFLLRDYRKITDDIWMPFHFAYELPDLEADEAELYQFKVSHLEVNCVRDACFTFDPPPGTLKITRDAGSSQVTAGGVCLLDKHASWILKRSGETILDKQSPNSLRSIVALVCSLAFVYAIWFSLRRWPALLKLIQLL